MERRRPRNPGRYDSNAAAPAMPKSSTVSKLKQATGYIAPFVPTLAELDALASKAERLKGANREQLGRAFLNEAAPYLPPEANKAIDLAKKAESLKDADPATIAQAMVDEIMPYASPEEKAAFVKVNGTIGPLNDAHTAYQSGDKLGAALALTQAGQVSLPASDAPVVSNKEGQVGSGLPDPLGDFSYDPAAEYKDNSPYMLSANAQNVDKGTGTYDPNFNKEVGLTAWNAIKQGVGNIIPDTINGGAVWIEQFTHSEPGSLGRVDKWVASRNVVADEASKGPRAVAGTALMMTPLKPVKSKAASGNTMEVGGSVGAAKRLEYVASPKHGKTPRKTTKGISNPKPTNGQAILDNSIQVKSTSPRRIGVDKKSNEIALLDQTSPGIFHGHVRSFKELTTQQKNALTKAGMTDRKGNIL